MIVFKTFLKVLNKNKFIVMLYTIMLLIFGGFNMQTSDTSMNFEASKPDIVIVNEDVNEGVTKNLIEYIEKNSNKKDVNCDSQSLDDALFYRELNYIIYIPKNYREDFLNGKNPKIDIKSTGDYQSSLAEMMLERYVEVANSYSNVYDNEDELINKINETLSKEANIEITSKLDTNNLAKATFYYNFASYSILAVGIYVICMILSSFKSEKIKKRTVISSINYSKYNMQLLLSNGLFAVILWLLYVLLSFILIGDIMYTAHGIIYIINSFIFTMCALVIAFFIGNIVSNKNAINGIVNVVALGSSFLCGAFVPMQWLPDTVLNIAHILPTYYYISNNEMVATIETINFESLKPIIINMAIIVLFIIVFIILTNIIAKRKRKIG